MKSDMIIYVVLEETIKGHEISGYTTIGVAFTDEKDAEEYVREKKSEFIDIDFRIESVKLYS
jgi:hypothetical protein